VAKRDTLALADAHHASLSDIHQQTLTRHSVRNWVMAI